MTLFHYLRCNLSSIVRIRVYRTMQGNNSDNWRVVLICLYKETILFIEGCFYLLVQGNTLILMVNFLCLPCCCETWELKQPWGWLRLGEVPLFGLVITNFTHYLHWWNDLTALEIVFFQQLLYTFPLHTIVFFFLSEKECYSIPIQVPLLFMLNHKSVVWFMLSNPTK